MNGAGQRAANQPLFRPWYVKSGIWSNPIKGNKYDKFFKSFNIIFISGSFLRKNFHEFRALLTRFFWQHAQP